MFEGEAEFIGGLLDAVYRSLEIGVAGLLVNDADVQAFARLGFRQRSARQNHQGNQYECKDFLHG